MKKISIGSWAYTIGPYESKPVSFEDVCKKLKALDFQGVELGGFPPHPNPDDLTQKAQREENANKPQLHRLMRQKREWKNNS